eukprot:scaffold8810_cov41-Phaeocystis_antarctica.AAC.1
MSLATCVRGPRRRTRHTRDEIEAYTFEASGLQQRPTVPFIPRRPVQTLKRKINGTRFYFTFCAALCGDCGLPLPSTALRIQA